MTSREYSLQPLHFGPSPRDSDTTKEVYEGKQREIEAVCNPILQNMYQGGAGGAGGMPPGFDAGAGAAGGAAGPRVEEVD